MLMLFKKSSLGTSLILTNMARNKSDIFCLKEAEYGDEQGTQIFSVNGSCAVRSNRKQKRAKPIEDLSEENISKDDESVKLNVVDYAISESHEKTDEKNSDNEIAVNDKSLSPKTKQEELINVVSSNSKMLRNPLTGDGIKPAENLTVQQKRRFENHTEKWLW